MPYHHHAHCNKVLVKVGDIVQRGQLIAEVGDSGTEYAHDHFEVAKRKPKTWTSYTKGMTRAQVLDLYENPAKYLDKANEIPVRMDRPNGYNFMDWSTHSGSYHAGVDLNGYGPGDADKGKPLKSTCYGRVVYVGNDGGWGNHVWIEEMAVPAPEPEKPKMFIKKVLVLFSHVDAQDHIKDGIKRYIDKVAARTNGEFTYEITYANTDQQFYTVRGTSTDGQSIVFVRSDEIGTAGGAVERNLGKEFNSVCLIYNPAFIIGEQPTNPVQNPVVMFGFNTYQIPSTWIATNPNDPTPFWGSQLFFGHEDGHSNAHLANALAGAGVRDKTHDPNPYSSTMIGANPDQTDWFIDHLIELKPYWHVIGTQVSGSTPPMAVIRNEQVKVFTLDINGALFVCKLSGGRQLVGAAAANPGDLNEKEDDFGVELVDAAGNVKPADAKITLPN